MLFSMQQEESDVGFPRGNGQLPTLGLGFLTIALAIAYVTRHTYKADKSFTVFVIRVMKMKLKVYLGVLLGLCLQHVAAISLFGSGTYSLVMILNAFQYYRVTHKM